MIFPEEYHPKKAERKETKGAFDVYHFKDGARLTIRRKHARNLFDPAKLSRARYKLYDSRGKAIKIWRSGRKLFSVRQPTLVVLMDRRHLLQCYNLLYRARVRFEAPVGWLESPKHSIVVAEFYKNCLPLRYFASYPNLNYQRIFEKVFHELGKMHGAGVRHGHPHLNNILLVNREKIYFSDPKILGRINEAPDITPAIGFHTRYFPNLGKGAKFDLIRLTCAVYNVHHAVYGFNWRKFVQAYKRGVEIGRKRTAGKA